MLPIVYGLAYIVFMYEFVNDVPCDMVLKVLRDVESADHDSRSRRLHL